MATITEVAKAAGVSIATASRVFTESEHAVNEATRERVLQAAKDLGYQPNMLASGLRRGKSFSVGIVLDSITGPFTPQIVQGIQEYLKQYDFASSIVNSFTDTKIENDSVRMMLGRQVDGIIFVDTNVHSTDQIAIKTNKPLIFVKRRTLAADENKNCISIIPDNRYGGELAARHLIQLGHRRIAHIKGPHGWDASRQREDGFRSILESEHIPLDETLFVEGDWTLESGYEAMQRLLSQPSRPSAVFVANDQMAAGAIYAIQDLGLRVPRDIAIVGYDNLELSRFIRPALTTVSQPLQQLGETAAKVFLEQLEGERANELTIEIRGELIVRESCGLKQKQTR
jgi:LacI family transcriptional regulator